MVSKENLSQKQVKRFEELSHEVGMNMFDWFRNEQQPYDLTLFNEISDIGIEMIALLKLYKEQLQSEGKLPLSEFSCEVENLNILIDGIEDIVVDFLPKGTIVNKQYVNMDEK